jgi:ABC-type polysaccharide transport system permease subunit
MRDPERRALWLMAAQFLVGVTVLVFGPALWTTAMALFEWDLIGSPRFVGLANFRTLFEDPVFGRAVRNSVLFLASVVPLKLLGPCSSRCCCTETGVYSPPQGLPCSCRRSSRMPRMQRCGCGC